MKIVYTVLKKPNHCNQIEIIRNNYIMNSEDDK